MPTASTSSASSTRLNDIRNLETAVKAANKEGGHAQIAISFTLGETFTTEYYVNYAKQIESIGAQSICLKDMAALLTPYHTYELVKAIKEAVKIPVDIHTHYTSGLASMCLLKGIEAGADIVDTAMSPRRWAPPTPRPSRSSPPSRAPITTPASTSSS